MTIGFYPRVMLFFGAVLALGLLLTVVPSLDLAVSGFFFDGADFPWRVGGLAEFLHGLVQPAAGIIALLLLGMTIAQYVRRAAWRRWAFVLLALLLGPGLVTNVIFKDHWGRARPMQVEQFGGSALFTPALLPADQCTKNCSFVSGDASFGFFMHSFAYIAPRRRRPLFWTGLGIGALCGLVRIGMGAHFLSDVAFAGLFTVLVSAGLYASMFGRRALTIMWREFLGIQNAPAGRVTRLGPG